MLNGVEVGVADGCSAGGVDVAVGMVGVVAVGSGVVATSGVGSAVGSLCGVLVGVGVIVDVGDGSGSIVAVGSASDVAVGVGAVGVGSGLAIRPASASDSQFGRWSSNDRGAVASYSTARPSSSMYRLKYSPEFDLKSPRKRPKPPSSNSVTRMNGPSLAMNSVARCLE